MWSGAGEVAPTDKNAHRRTGQEVDGGERRGQKRVAQVTIGLTPRWWKRRRTWNGARASKATWTSGQAGRRNRSIATSSPPSATTDLPNPPPAMRTSSLLRHSSIPALESKPRTRLRLVQVPAVVLLSDAVLDVLSQCKQHGRSMVAKIALTLNPCFALSEL